MTVTTGPPAATAGHITVAGRTVPRLGYGTMQLPGPRGFGPAPDPAAAVAVLRRAVDAGVRFLDTSGYYGPDVANQLIRQALHPYPDDLVIATKVGARRGPDGSFHADATPAAVRAAVVRDARILGVDAIDLVHARFMPDSTVPYTETVAALAALRDDGLIRAVGVSNVTADQLREAQRICPIATVENEYHVADRTHEPLVAACEREGITFLPFHPLALGTLATAAGTVRAVADELGATSAQVALAWLLRRSPAILPIPGTRSLAHLDENLAAGGLDLTATQVQRLDGVPHS